jgi:hypothetical protein
MTLPVVKVEIFSALANRFEVCPLKVGPIGFKIGRMPYNMYLVNLSEKKKALKRTSAQYKDKKEYHNVSHPQIDSFFRLPLLCLYSTIKS